jgi:hypothetical protein
MMAFRDRATLLDGLPFAVGDTPGGYPAGTRFMALGEPAKAERFNRAFAALAENTDDLDTRITRDIAVPEVGAFTKGAGFTSVVIDPTGAAGGDINYTGSLFVGSAGWADNKENRDSLFQFLDSNYNEVLVDGEEVYAASIAPAAIGGGFYSANAVTVSLRTANVNPVTVPSGSYRLGYFAGSTLATVDEAFLVSTSVRGLHEAPGESQKRAVWVCGPTGTSHPVDFLGSDAIRQALDATAVGEDAILFIRNGSYAVGALDIDKDGVTIIGESRDGVTLLTAANDLTISADNVRMEDLTIKSTGANTLLVDDGVSVSNVTLRNIYCYHTDLKIWRSHGVTVEKCVMGGCEVGGLSIVQSDDVVMSQCHVLPATDVSTASPAMQVFESVRCTFKNMLVEAEGTAGAGQSVLQITDASDKIVFVSSKFISTKMGGVARYVLQIIHADVGTVAFYDCEFEGIGGTLVNTTIYGALTMQDCKFTMLDGAAALSDTIAEFHKYSNSSSRGIILDNCDLTINRWDGGAGAWWAGTPCIEFDGVLGRHVTIDFSGMSALPCTGAAVFIEYSDIVDLKVNFDGLDTSGVANDTAIRVGYGGRVTDLSILGLTGDWNTAGHSILSLRGTSTAKAEVHGVTFDTGMASSWEPDLSYGLVELQSYSELDKLVYLNHSRDGSPPPLMQSIVSVGTLGTANVTDAEIHRCFIQLSGNAGEVKYAMIAASNARRTKIHHNMVQVTPKASSGFICAVVVDCSDIPTWPGPTHSHGNMFGEFCYNTIEYDGTNNNLGVDCNRLLWFMDGVCFWTICFNKMYVYDAVTDGGVTGWIVFDGDTIGTPVVDYTNETGGNVCFGNACWKADDTDVLAWVPVSHAGDGPAGLYEDSDLNVVVADSV